MEDLARQADLPGEVVVDVDRVEVARRAGVADGQVLVGRDLQRGDLVAGLHGCSLPPHDVRPRADAHRVAVLVLRDRLERVEAHRPARGDLLDGQGRLDLVAGDDERAPPELLGAVEQLREVDADLGVEHRRAEGHAAVDDAEHRRRDNVAIPGRARRLEVDVERVLLPHRDRVLADLLAPDGVDARRIRLADRGGRDRHGADPTRQRARWVAATLASTASAVSSVSGVTRSPSRSADHASVSTGWASWIWPTRATPPRASPAYQAKNARNIEMAET